MDTTEQYIKMRLAAIPELGRGDFPPIYTSWQSGLVYIDERGSWYYNSNTGASQSCRLERQDQLQEMVWNNYDHIAKMHILCDFLDLVQAYYDKSGILCSMEQLWLAFVMKTKFNKVWSGTDWKVV